MNPTEPGAGLRVHRAPADLLDRAVARRQRAAVVSRLALPLAIAATFTIGVLVGSLRDHPPAADEIAVRLLFYDASAQDVAVAGSWSGWQPERMTRLPDGTFLWEQSLPHGAHEYMFLVDGQWVTDPTARVVRDDGFGHRNALLDI